MRPVFSVITGVSVCLAGFLVEARGQPKEWSDDFLTVTTYDSNSVLAPCYSGPAPKYTCMEAGGDIFSERVIMGPRPDNRTGAFREGQVSVSNVTLAGGATWEEERFECLVLGWVGLNLGCPGEPAANITTAAFTSPDLCVYAAFEYNAWQLRYSGDAARLGADLYPGVAYVDDDQDGTTDGTIGLPGVDDDGDLLIDEYAEVREWDEWPGQRYGLGAGGYGPYPAGRDNRPGVAGVDDDGNGIIDDVGETCWSNPPGLPNGVALTDDGDDNQSRLYMGMMFKWDGPLGEAVNLNIDCGSSQSNTFALRQFIAAEDNSFVSGNELVRPYYKPQKRYNYALCVSGTCYGAQLWEDTDLANPDETLGPATNTFHTKPSANGVLISANPGYTFYIRDVVIGKGNSNFRDKFWVVSGPVDTYYPSPSTDFDDDKDVDGFDFLTFSNCYNGSNRTPLAACADLRTDLDKDGDVDGFDFLTFSNCYNGSNRKPLAACFPPNLTICPPP